ncbi:MAG: hypothetical protein ACRCSI_07565 [Eubacterium aggregans]
MLKKVIRWFVTLLGFIAGLATANILVNSSLLTDMLGIGMTQKIELGLYIFLILLFGIIFYFFSVDLKRCPTLIHIG